METQLQTPKRKMSDRSLNLSDASVGSPVHKRQGVADVSDDCLSPDTSDTSLTSNESSISEIPDSIKNSALIAQPLPAAAMGSSTPKAGSGPAGLSPLSESPVVRSYASVVENNAVDISQPTSAQELTSGSLSQSQEIDPTPAPSLADNDQGWQQVGRGNTSRTTPTPNPPPSLWVTLILTVAGMTSIPNNLGTTIGAAFVAFVGQEHTRKPSKMKNRLECMVRRDFVPKAKTFNFGQHDIVVKEKSVTGQWGVGRMSLAGY